MRFRVWLLDLLASTWALVLVLLAAVFGMAAIATATVGVGRATWVSIIATLLLLLIVVFLAYVGAASERDAPAQSSVKLAQQGGPPIDPRSPVENGDGTYTITDTLGAVRFS